MTRAFAAASRRTEPFGRAATTLLLAAFMGCSGEAHLEPSSAGPDYRLQGEYRAAGAPFAAQVIALGSGRFRGVLLRGGLPGEGFDGGPRFVAAGRSEGGGIVFSGDWQGAAREGHLVGQSGSGEEFSLQRVVRRSPTEGAKPPAEAEILFADAPTRHLAQGSADERGLLGVPARTAEPHRDLSLHVEFRTPYMPGSEDQGRGNSGIYLQERYEVQVLDSFGLAPHPRGAGAIYEAFSPRVNMSYPPLQWQTYDIEFSEARFDPDGRKIAPARISVRHNGVVIHDDIALSGPTGLGKDETPEPNPLLLQDHWDPVFFRNVWMVRRP